MDDAQPWRIPREDTITVFRESNNLYFSQSWYPGKDRNILKSNRENLHIEKISWQWGWRCIEKVVCRSCAVTTLIAHEMRFKKHFGTEGGFPSAGGLRPFLLPGVHVSYSRRFCSVMENRRKSVLLLLIWMAKWKCGVACDKLFA